MKLRETLRVHYLKCHPEPFWAVVADTKRHEVRKNDRDYQVGDVLVLRFYDPTPGPAKGEVVGYSGSECCRVITHITAGGTWGLPADLCVLSIQPFPVHP